MSIDEANDSLDLNIPEGEYNTIAGFVLEQLQQIPVEMQRFWYDDLRFQIIEVDGNKVERVLVRRRPTTQSTIG
jgi:putative hemolysin